YGKAYSIKRDREDKDKDEDPPAGSDQGLKRQKISKDAEPSKCYKSKESKSSSSKGTKSKPKSSGKSTQAEELVFETTSNLDQQNCSSKKPPISFDELMSTPIDFSAYVMHNLKIDNLTQDLLIGPTFNLLKGTCKSHVELEYNFEESYALSWKPCQGDSLNLPDHRYSIYTIKRETGGLDDGVAASFQRSRIHKPHAHTQAFKIESHKSSTEHPIVNEFVIINIPEEDIKPKQIILDPNDQSMWESVKTVAQTPNSAIIQLDVDDNFVINSTHLNMIRESKFDGYLRADPHDHIREFLAICNMFRYGETQSEAIKLLIFPFSLCDKAKTWFNELNEESITSWEQMRKAFIKKFFPPSLFNCLLLEIRSFSQLVCESLTEAWLRLKSMLRKCHGHGLTKGAIIQIFYHGLDEPTQGTNKHE
ncbi:reverse transcriptase domain-containing protein, partial [Tanacetum coccineum]